MNKRFVLLALLGVLIITIPAWRQINEVQAEVNKPPEIQTQEVQYIYRTDYIYTTEYVEVEAPFTYTDLGEFECTFYTAGLESTGKTPDHPAYGVTRSGAIVEEGVTIAVDPSVIALGSYVYVDGLVDYLQEIVGINSSNIRIAQDTGSAIKGNAIDIYVNDVEVARALGRKSFDVYLLD